MFLFGWGGREWNFSYFHIWSVLLIVILSEMINQINWYDGPNSLELVEVAVVFVDGSF